MEIKVLGGGCASCKKLLESVKAAVAELKIDADVIYVTDMGEIVGAGIMSTPALMIDGKVKAMGRVPKAKEIMQMIADERA
ncbi:MAG: thioredoxin family protein [Eubacteriales bacterium]|nr:thioredoxin family protein [Eubacteriales bacterium]